MKQYISIIGDSELQKRLKPLYELKSDINSLKSEINKKATAKFYTILQVCEILHLSRSTVYRMIRNGDLKAHKAYRRVLIPETSIKNLLINYCCPINSIKYKNVVFGHCVFSGRVLFYSSMPPQKIDNW